MRSKSSAPTVSYRCFGGSSLNGRVSPSRTSSASVRSSPGVRYEWIVIGAGATVVNAYLAEDSLADRIDRGLLDGPLSKALARYRAAIDAGVNFLDNAAIYNGGRSEELMGRALRDGYRDKVFLMTKTFTAERDADGDYKITGRVDDVINVSGHRLGTAEVEAALTSHPDVAEAAVVGFPHDIKGQGIFAYVTLNNNVEKTDDLKKALVAHVRKVVGPIASPDQIQWADGLPKTRSGKIMRRVLRNVASKTFGDFGDTSTLADPAVVDDLVANRKKLG